MDPYSDDHQNPYFPKIGLHDADTEEYKSAMENGQPNILVAVRVRPVLKKERLNNCREYVKPVDGRMLVITDPASDSNADDPLRANRKKEKRYAFDHVFDPRTTQRQVFEKTTLFLLDGVLTGYNATVFAYGATGSGKTHTMLGTIDHPGLMMLTLQELFRKIRATEVSRRYKVTLTYLEVYNENLRDLLNPTSEYLDLREDPIKGTMKVAGLTEMEATCAEDVLECLREGNKYRTQEATAANEGSSRSHAVLQIVIEQRDRTGDVTAEIKIGKLSMIDLAGSERASITQNRGIRMIEGANINRSLLALGNCINALGDKSNKGSYVPYRDSKLTRLLKDSLGGNCRTVMIAAVSPVNFEETLNTLKYAHRAKNIKTKVERNVLNVSYHVHQYMQIIADLRSEVSELKDKLVHSGTEDSNESEERQRERQVVEEMRNKISLNFEDRMQIRRSLMELEEQNIKNVMEINKIQLEISALDLQQNADVHSSFLHDFHSNASVADSFDGASDVSSIATTHSNAPRSKTPHRVSEARKEIRTILGNIEKNKRLKVDLIARLKKLEEEAKILHAMLPSMVQTKDMRELLEMNYRMRILELQNIELEEAALINGQMMQARQFEVKKVGSQLKKKDALLSRMLEFLRAQGCDLPGDLLAQYNNDGPNATPPSAAPASRHVGHSMDESIPSHSPTPNGHHASHSSSIPYEQLLYPSSIAMLHNIGISCASATSPVLFSPPSSKKKRRSGALSGLGDASPINGIGADESSVHYVAMDIRGVGPTNPKASSSGMSSLPPIGKSSSPQAPHGVSPSSRKMVLSSEEVMPRDVAFSNPQQRSGLAPVRASIPSNGQHAQPSNGVGARPNPLTRLNTKAVPAGQPVVRHAGAIGRLADGHRKSFSQNNLLAVAMGARKSSTMSDGEEDSEVADLPGHRNALPPGYHAEKVSARGRKNAFSEETVHDEKNAHRSGAAPTGRLYKGTAITSSNNVRKVPQPGGFNGLSNGPPRHPVVGARQLPWN
eukprot:ANDGO_00154.mRNA.1 hypothetical protein